MRSAFRLGALAAGIGLANPTAAAGAVPSGGIYLTTLPGAADVWIDGTYVGRSPVLIEALTPGRHGVTVTRTGWQAQRALVSVGGGGVAMESLRLVPESESNAGGTFVLRGVKASHAVLDGRPAGGDLARPTEAAAGEHVLAVTLPGGRLTRSFLVVPHTETEVVLRDAPPSRPERAAVDAPAEEYLSRESISVVDRRIVVRYGGHQVTGRIGERVLRYDGAPTTYESAPTQIGGRLYLPLDLLQRLASAGAPGASPLPATPHGPSPSPSPRATPLAPHSAAGSPAPAPSFGPEE